MNICAWCLKPRVSMEGWHSCPGSQDAKERIDKEVQTRLARYKRVAEGRTKK